MIPKRIYTYWNSSKLPDFLQKCLDTWHRFNSDFEIVVLSEANYREHCPVDVFSLKHISRDKNHQRTADFIRTIILKEHGGVWLDISSICTRNLGELIDGDKNGMVVFASDFSYKFKIIENWFIACAPGNEFMKKWHDEFVLRSQKFDTMDAYAADAANGLDKSSPWWHANSSALFGLVNSEKQTYFAMHIAAQVVLQKQGYPQDRLTILNAWKGGPLSYVHKHRLLCDKVPIGQWPIFIKIIGEERKKIDANPLAYDCLFERLKGDGAVPSSVTPTLATIPKQIFTYWNSPHLPELVQKCVDSMRHFNPGYRVVVMNETNYRRYCSVDVFGLKHISRDKDHQRTADFIRTIVLKEQGGVWLDSSTICTSSIDSLVSRATSGLVLWAADYGAKNPTIENWAIIAAPNNSFMRFWYEEFVVASQKYASMEDFARDASKGLDLNAPWWHDKITPEGKIKENFSLGYFAMHIAAQRVMQIRKYPREKMLLLDGFSPNAPLGYVYQFEKLCKDVPRELWPQPFVKLVRADRDSLSKSPDMRACIFKKLYSTGEKQVGAVDSNTNIYLLLCSIALICFFLVVYLRKQKS